MKMVKSQTKVVIKGADSDGGVIDLVVYGVPLSVFVTAPKLLDGLLKAAAHVRPTCSELYEELQSLIAEATGGEQ